MGLHADEIIAACQELGCNYKLLAKTEASTIHTYVEQRFARRASGMPLWERLHNDSSIYDKNGWKLIQTFTKSESILIFFERDEDQTIVELKKSENLVDILENCTGFVFYVTNTRFDYLFCFNDHDFLIAAGSAAKWVASLK